MLLPQLPQVKLDGIFQSQIKRIGDKGMANGNFEQVGHSVGKVVKVILVEVVVGI